MLRLENTICAYHLRLPPIIIIVSITSEPHNQPYVIIVPLFLLRSPEKLDHRLQVKLVVQQPLEGYEDRRQMRHAIWAPGTCPARPKQLAPAQLVAFPASQQIPLQEGVGLEVHVEVHRHRVHHAVGGAHSCPFLYFR